MQKEIVIGVVIKLHYASPRFSAGIIKTDKRDVPFTFRGLCSIGDHVRFEGRWTVHAKYGAQFQAERLMHDLPQSVEGLATYLARNPTFVGIGPMYADRIARYCNGNLDAVFASDHEIEKMYKQTLIPVKTLEKLREEWLKMKEENSLRQYLSHYDLTHNQISGLLEKFGASIVTILQNNPYKIIDYMPGYGFRRADAIAMKLGIERDNPGRIQAAIQYVLTEQRDNGHCWTRTHEIIDIAEELLIIDQLDARHKIATQANALLRENKIFVCKHNDSHIAALPELHNAEMSILQSLETRKNISMPRIDVTPPSTLNDGQRQAFMQAFSHPISIITGGAGTGKTYVVAAIAQACQEHELRITLCAPTGKAAKRMREVLSDRFKLRLSAETIHLLLEYDGEKFGVHTIDTDVLIVDEMSMVDVPLFSALLERVPLNTRIILVGDHHQLPPVGPGMPLRDMLQRNLVPTTQLDQVMRQAGELKINAYAILDGKVEHGKVNSSEWILVNTGNDIEAQQLRILNIVMNELPKLGYTSDNIQVLTHTHKGPLGTRELNKLFQEAYHPGIPLRGRFHVGDRVIQTQNDYGLGIMNGEQGHVVKCEPGEYMLVDFDGRQVEISEEKQRNLELAYVLTVHKAQGSEWPAVVVVCHRSHWFAHRHWLYTAVTRASRTLIIVSDSKGVWMAAGKNQTEQRRTFMGLSHIGKEVRHGDTGIIGDSEQVQSDRRESMDGPVSSAQGHDTEFSD